MPARGLKQHSRIWLSPGVLIVFVRAYQNIKKEEPLLGKQFLQTGMDLVNVLRRHRAKCDASLIGDNNRRITEIGDDAKRLHEGGEYMEPFHRGDIPLRVRSLVHNAIPVKEYARRFHLMFSPFRRRSIGTSFSPLLQRPCQSVTLVIIGSECNVTKVFWQK